MGSKEFTETTKRQLGIRAKGRKVINENTPLAKVLLDSAVGDELKLEIKASLTRFIRVLRIHRQKGTIETHIPPSFYKQLKLTVPFFENKK